MRIIQLLFRPVAIPVLILLYIGAAPPLWGRQVCHRITKFMDWAFDFVAHGAGWDTTYWPLPKASDNPLEDK